MQNRTRAENVTQQRPRAEPKDQPPIPERVVTPAGETLFTRNDILDGMNVFGYGIMEHTVLELTEEV